MIPCEAYESPPDSYQSPARILRKSYPSDSWLAPRRRPGWLPSWLRLALHSIPDQGPVGSRRSAASRVPCLCSASRSWPGSVRRARSPGLAGPAGSPRTHPGQRLPPERVLGVLARES